MLQTVSGFPEPDYRLEQYPTPPELAAEMLFAIHASFDDIEDKRIADVGCGPGMLGIGAALLGARYGRAGHALRFHVC